MLIYRSSRFGKAVMDLLDGHHTQLSESMIVSPGEATSYSIVIEPGNVDRIFLHCTGANDTFDSKDLKAENLEQAMLFHFGYPPLMKQMYNIKRVPTESSGCMECDEI